MSITKQVACPIMGHLNMHKEELLTIMERFDESTVKEPREELSRSQWNYIREGKFLCRSRVGPESFNYFFLDDIPSPPIDLEIVRQEGMRQPYLDTKECHDYVKALAGTRRLILTKEGTNINSRPKMNGPASVICWDNVTEFIVY